ncbi:MAG: hypothetical protein R3B72_09245 [Polyangiaceae bacterium]
MSPARAKPSRVGLLPRELFQRIAVEKVKLRPMRRGELRLARQVVALVEVLQEDYGVGLVLLSAGVDLRLAPPPADDATQPLHYPATMLGGSGTLIGSTARAVVETLRR